MQADAGREIRNVFQMGPMDGWRMDARRQAWWSTNRDANLFLQLLSPERARMKCWEGGRRPIRGGWARVPASWARRPRRSSSSAIPPCPAGRASSPPRSSCRSAARASRGFACARSRRTPGGGSTRSNSRVRAAAATRSRWSWHLELAHRNRRARHDRRPVRLAAARRAGPACEVLPPARELPRRALIGAHGFTSTRRISAGDSQRTEISRTPTISAAASAGRSWPLTSTGAAFDDVEVEPAFLRARAPRRATDLEIAHRHLGV